MARQYNGGGSSQGSAANTGYGDVLTQAHGLYNNYQSYQTVDNGFSTLVNILQFCYRYQNDVFFTPIMTNIYIFREDSVHSSQIIICWIQRELRDPLDHVSQL